MITPLILNELSLINPWIQGMYWGNFKGLSTPNNLQHWRGFFGKFFNRPYIIFTGTNHLPLENLKLNSEAIDYINNHSLRIFCYEPLHLRLLDEPHNRGWFTEFKSNTPYQDIKSDELDSISNFVKKYNLTRVGVHSPNYRVAEILGPSYPELLVEDHMVFCKLLRQHADVVSPIVEKNIKKTFHCLNNRYAFHRHLVMAYLAKFKGFYSWQFEVDSNFINHIEWLDLEKFGESNIKRIQEGNEILNQNHFYVDYEFEKIKIDQHFNHYYKTTPLLSLSSGIFKNIHRSYQESFVSVVTESRYAQPLGFVSEKTTSCVMKGSPFVLVGAPRSLEYFKEKFEIKTFSDYWDESYDLEEDHTLRINKIFQTLDYIANLSTSEQEKIYKSMKKLLEENKEKLRIFTQIDSVEKFRIDPLIV